MSRKVEIEVGTLMIDGQDGGYTMYLYPSYEAAKAAKQKNADENDYDFDDDYETGYLEKDTLTLLIDDDGKIALAGKQSFHVGQ